MTLNPDQFDMRPNIKAKEGSQGVLFRGGPRTQQWPRGYTPERQQDVHAALGLTRPWHGVQGKPVNPRTGFQVQKANAEVRDTVSRSTIPVADMKGVGLVAGQERADGAAGAYYSKGFSGRGSSQISIAEGHSQNMTPIHEIGHHVSRVQRTEHSYMSGRRTVAEAGRRGREEGFAENYSETHFRDRRDKTQRSTSDPFAWHESYFPEAEPGERWSEQHRFDLSFKEKRKESPLHPKQFDFDSSAARGLPKGHIEGQLPLLDKVRTYDDALQSLSKGSDAPESTVAWEYTHESGLRREGRDG